MINKEIKKSFFECVQGSNVNLENVKKLLKEHPELLNELDEEGNAAFHIAVVKNNLDLARLLIDNHCDSNKQNNKDKATPLHLAIDLRNIEFVKFLLSKGASIELVDFHNKTSLQFAEYLLENSKNAEDQQRFIAIVDLLKRALESTKIKSSKLSKYKTPDALREFYEEINKKMQNLSDIFLQTPEASENKFVLQKALRNLNISLSETIDELDKSFVLSLIQHANYRYDVIPRSALIKEFGFDDEGDIFLENSLSVIFEKEADCIVKESISEIEGTTPDENRKICYIKAIEEKYQIKLKVYELTFLSSSSPVLTLLNNEEGQGPFVYVVIAKIQNAYMAVVRREWLFSRETEYLNNLEWEICCDVQFQTQIEKRFKDGKEKDEGIKQIFQDLAGKLQRSDSIVALRDFLVNMEVDLLAINELANNLEYFDYYRLENTCVRIKAHLFRLLNTTYQIKTSQVIQSLNEQKKMLQEKLNKLKQDLEALEKVIHINEVEKEEASRKKEIFKQIEAIYHAANVFAVNADENHIVKYRNFLKNNDILGAVKMTDGDFRDMSTVNREYKDVIKSILENAIQPPKIQRAEWDREVLFIDGENVRLSKVIGEINKLLSPKPREIMIQASGICHVDIDLKFPGSNLIILADTLLVLKKISINVSGTAPKSIVSLRAQDGKTTGKDGSPGNDGEGGENAGNVLIKVKQFNEKETNSLTLIMNGADGVKGQDGGNGKDGRLGRDGDAAEIKNFKRNLFLNKAVHETGLRGISGENGGWGGAAGLGGAGGQAGKAEIWIDERKIQVHTINKHGENGADGKAGAAGRGTKDGRKGNDHAIVSKSWPNRQEKKDGTLELKKSKHWYYGTYYEIKVVQTSAQLDRLRTQHEHGQKRYKSQKNRKRQVKREIDLSLVHTHFSKLSQKNHQMLLQNQFGNFSDLVVFEKKEQTLLAGKQSNTKSITELIAEIERIDSEIASYSTINLVDEHTIAVSKEHEIGRIIDFEEKEDDTPDFDNDEKINLAESIFKKFSKDGTKRPMGFKKKQAREMPKQDITPVYLIPDTLQKTLEPERLAYLLEVITEAYVSLNATDPGSEINIMLTAQVQSFLKPFVKKYTAEEDKRKQNEELERVIYVIQQIPNIWKWINSEAQIKVKNFKLLLEKYDSFSKLKLTKISKGVKKLLNSDDINISYISFCESILTFAIQDYFVLYPALKIKLSELQNNFKIGKIYVLLACVEVLIEVGKSDFMKVDTTLLLELIIFHLLGLNVVGAVIDWEEFLKFCNESTDVRPRSKIILKRCQWVLSNVTIPIKSLEKLYNQLKDDDLRKIVKENYHEKTVEPILNAINKQFNQLSEKINSDMEQLKKLDKIDEIVLRIIQCVLDKDSALNLSEKTAILSKINEALSEEKSIDEIDEKIDEIALGFVEDIFQDIKELPSEFQSFVLDQSKSLLKAKKLLLETLNKQSLSDHILKVACYLLPLFDFNLEELKKIEGVIYSVPSEFAKNIHSKLNFNYLNFLEKNISEHLESELEFQFGFFETIEQKFSTLREIMLQLEEPNSDGQIDLIRECIIRVINNHISSGAEFSWRTIEGSIKNYLDELLSLITSAKNMNEVLVSALKPFNDLAHLLNQLFYKMEKLEMPDIESKMKAFQEKFINFNDIKDFNKNFSEKVNALLEEIENISTIDQLTEFLQLNPAAEMEISSENTLINFVFESEATKILVLDKIVNWVSAVFLDFSKFLPQKAEILPLKTDFIENLLKIARKLSYYSIDDIDKEFNRKAFELLSGCFKENVFASMWYSYHYNSINLLSINRFVEAYEGLSAKDYSESSLDAEALLKLETDIISLGLNELKDKWIFNSSLFERLYHLIQLLSLVLHDDRLVFKRSITLLNEAAKILSAPDVKESDHDKIEMLILNRLKSDCLKSECRNDQKLHALLVKKFEELKTAPTTDFLLPIITVLDLANFDQLPQEDAKDILGKIEEIYNIHIEKIKSDETRMYLESLLGMAHKRLFQSYQLTAVEQEFLDRFFADPLTTQDIEHLKKLQPIIIDSLEKSIVSHDPLSSILNRFFLLIEIENDKTGHLKCNPNRILTSIENSIFIELKILISEQSETEQKYLFTALETQFKKSSPSGWYLELDKMRDKLLKQKFRKVLMPYFTDQMTNQSIQSWENWSKLLDRSQFFTAEFYSVEAWPGLMKDIIWKISNLSKDEKFDIEGLYKTLIYFPELGSVQIFNQIIWDYAPSEWSQQVYLSWIMIQISNLFSLESETLSSVKKRLLSVSEITLEAFANMILLTNIQFEKSNNGQIAWEELDVLINQLLKTPLSSNTLQELKDKSFLQWVNRLRELSWLQQLNIELESSISRSYLQALNSLMRTIGEDKINRLLNTVAVKSCFAFPVEVEILLSRFAKGVWDLDDVIFTILNTEFKAVGDWEQIFKNLKEHCDRKKQNNKRDLKELIDIMKQEVDGYNQPIAALLKGQTHETELFKDLSCVNQFIHQSKPLTFNSLKKKCLNQLTKEDIRNWSSAISELDKIKFIQENLHEVIAIVAHGLKLFFHDQWSGNYPRDTQLIAVWLFLKAADAGQSRLGQIGTGEGKTVIVAMAAIIRALMGDTIDILTSSKVLAKRDSEELQGLYAMFNIHVSNNCDDKCEEAQERTERYQTCQVIYGEIVHFQQDILLTEFFEDRVLGGRQTTQLFVDEVDSMLLDKSENMLYLSHQIPDLIHLRQLFLEIWMAVNDVKLTGSESDKINVREFILLRQHQGEISVPNTLKEFVSHRLNIWIHNAFLAKRLKQDDPYIISKHTGLKDGRRDIVIVDKDTGVELASTKWSNGLHQFLQLKHEQKLSTESLKSVFISNLNYFKRYNGKIIGMTGTLGSSSELELLKKTYELDQFNLPRFQASVFTYQEDIVLETKEDWLEKLKTQSINLLASSRGVLILCENIRVVHAIEQKINEGVREAKLSVECKTYVSAYEKFDIAEVTGKTIIIATNLAGRGTDLKISNDLSKNHGMHVIFSYLPPNLRVQNQGFGRAGRNGQPGSGQFVILNTRKLGSTMIDLIAEREKVEEDRLILIMSKNIPKIQLEEVLFEKFKTLYKLARQQLQSMTIEPSYRDGYIEIQLKQLETHWAFWLDSMAPKLNLLPVISKEDILTAYDQFSKNMQSQLTKIGYFKLVRLPTQLLQLGRMFQDLGKYDKAIRCFDKIINDDPLFSEKAHYYKAAVILTKNGKSGDSKKSAKRSLSMAQRLIKEKIQMLSTSCQILSIINTRSNIENAAASETSGITTNYEVDISDQIKALSGHLQATVDAIGSTVEAAVFEIGVVDSKKASEIYKETLIKCKDYFKVIRVSKKISSNSNNTILQLKCGSQTYPIPFPKVLAPIQSEIIKILLFKKDNGRTISASDFSGLITDLLKKLSDSEKKKPEEVVVKFLIEMGALKAPVLNFSLNSKEKQINEKLKRIKTKIQEAAKLKLKDFKPDIRKKYVSQVIKNLKATIGKLKTMDEIKVDLINLREVFAEGDMPSYIVSSFIEQIFDHVLELNEKTSWWNWNAFAVAMIGIAQIAAGVLLEILTAGAGTYIANMLISEGVGDIMYAIETGATGSFSWEDYGTYKAISVAISIVTAGVSAWLSKGARLAKYGLVGKDLIKTAGAKIIGAAIGKAVVMETFKGAAFGLANLTIDQALNMLTESLIEAFKGQAKEAAAEENKEAKKEFEGLLKDLKAVCYEEGLFEKVIKETLGNILTVFSDASVDTQISSRIQEVLGSLMGTFEEAVSKLERSGASTKKIAMAKLLAKLAKHAGQATMITHVVVECVKEGKIYSAFNNELKTKIEILKQEKKPSINITDKNFQDQYDETIKQLDENMIQLIVQTVKNGLVSPLIKTKTHKIMTHTAHIFKNSIDRWQSKDIASCFEKMTGSLYTPGAEHKLSEFQTMLFRLVDDAHLVSSDNVFDEMQLHGRTKLTTVGKFREIYGDVNSFYRRKDGTVYSDIPSFEFFVSQLGAGKKSGIFELHLSAEIYNHSIKILDPGNNYEPHHLMSETIHPGGKPNSNDIFEVAFIKNYDNDEGHFAPVVRDADGKPETVQITADENIKNSCLQQSLLFLDFKVNKNMDEAEAKEQLKNPEVVKALITVLQAEALTQPKYRAVYFKKLQEEIPELVGGGKRSRDLNIDIPLDNKKSRDSSSSSEEGLGQRISQIKNIVGDPQNFHEDPKHFPILQEAFENESIRLAVIDGLTDKQERGCFVQLEERYFHERTLDLIASEIRAVLYEKWHRKLIGDIIESHDEFIKLNKYKKNDLFVALKNRVLGLKFNDLGSYNFFEEEVTSSNRDYYANNTKIKRETNGKIEREWIKESLKRYKRNSNSMEDNSHIASIHDVAAESRVTSRNHILSDAAISSILHLTFDKMINVRDRFPESLPSLLEQVGLNFFNRLSAETGARAYKYFYTAIDKYQENSKSREWVRALHDAIYAISNAPEGFRYGNARENSYIGNHFDPVYIFGSQLSQPYLSKETIDRIEAVRSLRDLGLITERVAKLALRVREGAEAGSSLTADHNPDLIHSSTLRHFGIFRLTPPSRIRSRSADSIGRTLEIATYRNEHLFLTANSERERRKYENRHKKASLRRYVSGP